MFCCKPDTRSYLSTVFIVNTLVSLNKINLVEHFGMRKDIGKTMADDIGLAYSFPISILNPGFIIKSLS